jgi:hypothetical protein
LSNSFSSLIARLHSEELKIKRLLTKGLVKFVALQLFVGFFQLGALTAGFVKLF